MVEGHELSSVVDTSECDIWPHCTTKEGFPLKWYEGKTRMWHRCLYEIEHKITIPPGMCVLRKCGNRRCINVGHMYLGTYKDNFDDARLKGHLRWAVGEAHGRATLCAKDVKQIRMLLKDGKPLRQIGDLFGVGSATIWRIKHGKTWKSVR